MVLTEGVRGCDPWATIRRREKGDGEKGYGKGDNGGPADFESEADDVVRASRGDGG